MTDKTTIFLFAAFLIALWYRLKPTSISTNIGNITQNSTPSLGSSADELAAVLGLFKDPPTTAAPEVKPPAMSSGKYAGAAWALFNLSQQ